MATLGPREVPSDGGPLVYVDDLDHPLLAGDDRHHVARVRRVRDGEPMILSDGVGRWRRATMAGDQPRPEGDVVAAPRPEPSVGVAFALVKGAKPELVVQKLTELGVDRIMPFVAARSVVRWDQDKAVAAHVRWTKVAREAAMQSRQAWLPGIHALATFAEVAGEPGACLADRGAAPPSLAHPLVIVGPEGGWDDVERGVEVPTVRLSTGVLRAETAAIVAGGLLVALRSATVAPAAGA